MSKKTIWDQPDVDAAVKLLNKALEKALRKQAGERMGNLLITVVSKEKSIANFYDGCTCPACTIFTLQGISADVFKLSSEVVPRSSLGTGTGQKVH